MNNSVISKLKNYVDQKFDEAAMKCLKENILSDIKKHFSDLAKRLERCCSININGNNNITIKPSAQKDSVEISLESINNNDITKNNAREEWATATNTTEINKDVCDTQNNIVVDHVKNYAKKVK